MSLILMAKIKFQTFIATIVTLKTIVMVQTPTQLYLIHQLQTPYRLWTTCHMAVYKDDSIKIAEDITKHFNVV